MSSQASKLTADKQGAKGEGTTRKSSHIGTAVAVAAVAGIGALTAGGLLWYYWTKSKVAMANDRHRYETNPRYFVDERGAAVDESCPTCFENMDPGNGDLSELPCGHMFHTACADDWHKYNPTCPLCRRPY